MHFPHAADNVQGSVVDDKPQGQVKEGETKDWEKRTGKPRLGLPRNPSWLGTLVIKTTVESADMVLASLPSVLLILLDK